eukprot:355434-Chlamydomonas_euryale.AAC.3
MTDGRNSRRRALLQLSQRCSIVKAPLQRGKQRGERPASSNPSWYTMQQGGRPTVGGPPDEAAHCASATAARQVIRRSALKLGRRRVTKSTQEDLQLSVQASHGTCSRRISTILQGGGPARRDHPPVQGRLALGESRVPPGGCKSYPHAHACLVDSEQSRSTHGLPSAGMHMRCRRLHEPEVLHVDGRTGGPRARMAACATGHHQKACHCVRS